jgi:hypothetical protein
VAVVSWAGRTGELCVVVGVGDLAFGPSLFSSTNLQLVAGRVAVGPSLRRQGTARGYRVDAIQVDWGREAAPCRDNCGRRRRVHGRRTPRHGERRGLQWDGAASGMARDCVAHVLPRLSQCRWQGEKGEKPGF